MRDMSLPFLLVLLVKFLVLHLAQVFGISAAESLGCILWA